MSNSNTTTPVKQPTPTEAMFFYAIVKHTKNKADIDWAAVAETANFKNAEVAKVRFGQIKRKLGISDSSPASARSKKDPNNSDVSTPTKVKKAPASRVGAKGRKGAKGKAQDDEVKPEQQESEHYTVSTFTPMNMQRQTVGERDDEEAMKEDVVKEESGTDDDNSRDPF